MESFEEIETRLKARLLDKAEYKLFDDAYVLWENHLLKIYIKSTYFEDLFKTDNILQPANNIKSGDWSFGRTGYLTGNLDDHGYFGNCWGHSNHLYYAHNYINPYILSTVGIKDGITFEAGLFVSDPKKSLENITNKLLDKAKTIFRTSRSAYLYKVDCKVSSMNV